MKKNILLFMLIFGLLFTYVLPGGEAFAEDLNEGALELFLSKLSDMEDGDRQAAGEALKIYMEDDEGVSKLKRDLSTFISDSQEEQLKDHGYSLDDVKSELDRLNKWSKEDRVKLADYIGEGNTSAIKSLIYSYEEGDKSDTSNNEGNPSGGNGGSTTPVVPLAEGKKDEEKLLEVYFKDIGNSKGKDAIVFLAQRGIITGRTKETFDPSGELTRAEFVTLIQRLLKLEPKAENAMPFRDIKEGDWFYNAVKSAYDNGIITGTGPDSFSPKNRVTREQMITIVMRILNDKGLTFTLKDTGKSLDDFKDKGEVSPWAALHMVYAVKYGIVEGKTEDTLNPKDFATREEAAVTIKRLFDILNK